MVLGEVVLRWRCKLLVGMNGRRCHLPGHRRKRMEVTAQQIYVDEVPNSACDWGRF